MTPVITTARDLFKSLHTRLQLSWATGPESRDRQLCNRDHPIYRAMVGRLDPTRSHRITILGEKELEYLAAQTAAETTRLCTRMASEPLSLIAIGHHEDPPKPLLDACARFGTPLWTTPITSHELMREIQYHVDSRLTLPTILHGVLLDVLGVGVLITGAPGVGKSELALELISRGHRLIADDAPEFRRTAPDTVTGACPESLKDFIEVRGLGVLDIRAMYGDSAIEYRQNLRLIVRLEAMNEAQRRQIDRLHGSHGAETLLGVTIPKVTLPVAAGRDLAVLLEAAVRNQLLLFKGYNAGERFIQRQSEQLQKSG